MTDHDLDRALANALDVEHGADFLARVRMRVAAEPPPSVWLAPWRMAAGAAAVAVVAAGLTFWNGADQRPIETVARGPVSQAAVVTPSAAPAAPVVELVEPVAATTRAGGRAAAPAAAVVVLPEPIISSEDAQLVGLLAASARRGIVADLLSPEDSAGQALELAALNVPLMGAEKPIEMNAVDGGERQ